MKKPNCTFADFLKLDVRVGQIKSAIPVVGSNKLLLLSVDTGADYGVVEILSGIAKYVAPADLIDKRVPVVANLEPKQMAGKTSHGFILMGDLEGHIAHLFFLPETLPIGSVIC
ncbi:methionine--tRNA ligase [Candidatus Roizmanbacteria bacterium CG_4_10_14_0_8_um_filter_39_9]|uniref:Methionine--tRNA ligase n=1 Tax=Candidatus Roizmanbacteria bacterium CG_4_10_14_0_8_um_filter_39_9 TaxID=1974829 RepID=A0A2M7QDK9_9BACT|nr:MAG: methionine--tRNA ligase [Candidatus Roizmanbacteria bacterium CG_4_10_14_0_8_um_filter_39_9]